MTKREAKQAIGRVVAWPDMDMRIDPISVILEEVKENGFAKIMHKVEGRPGRFTTYKPYRQLTVIL